MPEKKPELLPALSVQPAGHHSHGETHRGADSGADPGPGDHTGPQARGRRPEIRSEEDCVAALGQLPGLITMGLIAPAQANAIARSLREVIRYHELRRSQSAAGATLGDEDLLQTVRDNPQMLGLLEPLLTDEQVAMVIGGAGDE